MTVLLCVFMKPSQDTTTRYAFIQCRCWYRPTSWGVAPCNHHHLFIVVTPAPRQSSPPSSSIYNRSTAAYLSVSLFDCLFVCLPVYLSDIRFQKQEFLFQMPELSFQMPKHRFQMPEFLFQMPELRGFFPGPLSQFASFILKRSEDVWTTQGNWKLFLATCKKLNIHALSSSPSHHQPTSSPPSSVPRQHHFTINITTKAKSSYHYLHRNHHHHLHHHHHIISTLLNNLLVRWT